MKRILMMGGFTLFWLIIFCVTALALDVKVGGVFSPSSSSAGVKFAHEGPGIPPDNAFPLVCYVVGMPFELAKAIEKEARDAEEAEAKGQTIPRPLAERFKDGVPMPMFLGYYVASEDFRLTYTSPYPAPNRTNSVALFNEKETSYKGRQNRSWHGVLAYIQSASSSLCTDTMVYTLGVPPDPDYVPEIRKSVRIPLSTITNPGVLVYYPRQADYDAAITNVKPGMTFKVIGNDFIIP